MRGKYVAKKQTVPCRPAALLQHVCMQEYRRRAGNNNNRQLQWKDALHIHDTFRNTAKNLQSSKVTAAKNSRDAVRQIAKTREGPTYFQNAHRRTTSRGAFGRGRGGGGNSFSSTNSSPRTTTEVKEVTISSLPIDHSLDHTRHAMPA